MLFNFHIANKIMERVMANPRLEKHILAIAAVLLAAGVVVMLIWNLGRLFSVLGLMAGYVPVSYTH